MCGRGGGRRGGGDPSPVPAPRSQSGAAVTSGGAPGAWGRGRGQVTGVGTSERGGWVAAGVAVSSGAMRPRATKQASEIRF